MPRPLWLLALLLLGCGDAAPRSSADAAPDLAPISTPLALDGQLAPEPAVDAAPAPAACPAKPLAAGAHVRTLQHAGAQRDYDLYIPKRDPGHPLPVVFYLHPLGTAKGYLESIGGGAQKAEAAGFVAVFPNGLGGSWSAGACCGPSNGASGGQPVDDVGFVRAVLAEVQTLTCVDPRRVYATGFSNGGFLSHRLACEAADLFAAVAPVSAVNGMPAADCKPARPVPILMINGTTDILVPYQGGFSFPLITNGSFIGVAETFEGWRQRDGCSGEAQQTLGKGTARCLTYASCGQGAKVTQCTLEGAGHCWFGEPFCVMGKNTTDLSAVDATWEFLREFTL